MNWLKLGWAAAFFLSGLYFAISAYGGSPVAVFLAPLVAFVGGINFANARRKDS